MELESAAVKNSEVTFYVSERSFIQRFLLLLVPACDGRCDTLGIQRTNI